ncbi:MAG: hypothetical protein KAG84_04365 [Bacteroidales bacterium]|nr:hypothetical protein [Bacteroidales bacterium]
MNKLNYERPIINKIENTMPNKIGGRSGFKPITEIDGVRIKGMISNFGSPLFVISEATIRKTYQSAYRAFTTRYPKVQFAWSYKTNYLNAVCNTFHQEGSWAEVVSGFEYEKAINNGVDGRHIIFNGPDKTKADLQKAIANQSLIHIDHLDEYYMILNIAEETNLRPQVAIRVNMDTGIYPMWDRFGFNYENGQAWDVLNKIMMNKKMDLIGLHAHIGTYMMEAEPYKIAASKLSELAVSINKKYNHYIKYIDLGGGFASNNTLKGAYLPAEDTNPTIDDYAEAISSALLNSNIDPDHLPLLILETGRALIDDAGSLLGTVITNKRDSKGARNTVLDIGVNILFTSFWYNHKITPVQSFSHHIEDTKIYGPLCMNIDVIRESISLPPLNTGDNVIIHRVGAYNMTQWMQFITLRPAVVMISEKGDVNIIRESEKIEAITDYEKVPSHLKDFDL